MCQPHFASVISDPSTTLHAYQSPHLTEDSLSACPEPSSERPRLGGPRWHEYGLAAGQTLQVAPGGLSSRVRLGLGKLGRMGPLHGA